MGGGGWGLGGGKVDGGVGVRRRDGGWGGVGVRGREGGCVSKLKTCYFFHF